MKIKQVKSKIFTSKYSNENKVDFVYELFDYVKSLKNQMSEFCYSHINDVLNNPKFINNYKLFNNNLLPAHTVQTLFSEIINHYQLHVLQLVNNKLKKIRVQDKIVIHNRKSKHRLELVFKKPALCRFMAYAVKSFIWNPPKTKEEFIHQLQQIKSKNAEKFLEFYTSHDERFQVKFFQLMISIIENTLNKIKLIEYKNGTFRLTTSGYSYDLLYDESNKKFKWFLELHIRKRRIRFPLLENTDYFKKLTKDGYKKQIILLDQRNLRNTKKLKFIIAEDSEIYLPSEVKEIVGIDLNLNKETFIISSNNIRASYPEKLFEELLSRLEEIDKVGYQNLNKRQKQRLGKLVRKFRWYIIYEISKFIKKLKQLDITDIVMEDLEVQSKLYGYLKIGSKKIKTSRFIRLLHLSDIKNIFVNICHNKGIRVHLVPSNYTSQQCSRCGNIDPNNRKSQEQFICTHCGYTENADLNAANNIKNRLLFTRLLRQDKETKEFRSRKLSSNQIKRILGEDVLLPVVHSLHHQVLCILNIYMFSSNLVLKT